MQAAHLSPASGVALECVQGTRRVLYSACAAVCFLLAVVGVVLPGLPTTPFLLLTSYLLARSWPRMNRLLLSNRLFGPMLRDWQRHRSLAPRVKGAAMAMVIVAVLGVVCLSSLPGAAVAGIASAAVCGLVVIHRLPTKPATE